MYGLLSAVIASAVSGQAPTSPPFVTSVEVRVVNVEVVATDSNDEFLTDLRPEDFEVLEDGKPVEVTNFFKVIQAQPQLSATDLAQGVSPGDERFRRRVVLVVDNNFLDAPTRARALERAKGFLGQALPGETEWAVAAVGEGLQYLLPFTTDFFRVTAALDEIMTLPSFATRHRLEFRLENDPVRSQYLQAEEAGRTSRYDLGQIQRFASQERARRNLLSFALTAKVLAGLMRSYGTFGGRKAVVLLTGAMEFHPEAQYLVSSDPKTWADSGLTDRTQSDPALEHLKRETEGVLQTLVETANSAGFQFYVVNAQGLESPLRLHDVGTRQLGLVKNLGSFIAPPETSDPETAPLTLTQGTGGLYLRSSNVEKPLARILEDTATYYSIGYQPPHTPDGKFHRIAVKVKRAGVKVRHRQGYWDLSDEDKFAQELATPLIFPKQKGTLPVNLQVEEKGPQGKEVEVAASLSLPLREMVFLPQSNGGLIGSCTVFLAVYNEEGENLTVIPKTYPLSVPQGQEAYLQDGVFRATLLFTVPPGAYTISVTLWDQLGGQQGTALRQVLVGEKP